MACLDTCVLLDVSGRGGPRARQNAARCLRRLVRSGEQLVTTRFTVAELWIGIQRSRNPQREQASIETLLADFEILDFDDTAARIFGRVTASLQEAGRPVGDMDVLIAAVAMANGHILVTRNINHFAQVPGLGLESY